MGKTLTNKDMMRSLSMRSQLQIFVDIKFSKVGVAFAYGLTVHQDGEEKAFAAFRSRAFYDAHAKIDWKYLKQIARFDQVADHIALGRQLQDNLIDLERLDFVIALKQAGDSHLCEVVANRMSLVYLQALMPSDVFKGFQFTSFDSKMKGVDNTNNLLESIGREQELDGLPFNPLSTARAMAIACLDSQRFAA